MRKLLDGPAGPRVPTLEEEMTMADRTSRRPAWWGILLLPVLLLALAACAAGPNTAATGDATDLAGFWLGLWHGVISPVTFVISLFTDQVNLYEVRNDGNWYDVGFIVGVSVAFSGAGGSGAAARRGRGRR